MPATIRTRSSRSATRISSPAAVPMPLPHSTTSSTSIQRAGSAYENVGIAQLQAGNLPAAEEALRKALELEPTLGGAHTALGVVLASTARKADAIDEWKRAIELDGSDLNALFNLTLNLAETGRTQEARSYGERFIAAAPPAMREDVATVRKAIR